MRQNTPTAGATWRKVAALALAVAATGLPLNHIASYALLVNVAVLIFTGEVRTRTGAWIVAAAIVLVGIGGQLFISPARVAEGHNIFLPEPGGVLERGLPPDVYRHMAEQFDVQYPLSVRCQKNSGGCWQNHYPAQTFAFSADGVFHASDFSRAVDSLDFSDPVWLGIGFINELRYNWYTVGPDVHRADRDRRFWMGLHRWHLAMPWFEMIRLPPEFVGGELCWRGEIMWEGADGHFAALPGDKCRAIGSDDTGRHIVGIAIKPDTLAMHLTPPWHVRLLQLASITLELAALIGLVLVLVRINVRRAVLPLILIGLAVLAISIDDASFLGGIRPFDGGDDGLFYDSVGRDILRQLLAGDIYGALEGGEKVFYFGGPGLRYFRAIEHVLFGETYLGYLAIVLLLPVLTWRLARHFLPERWSLALALIFTAIPLGELFGTTFIDYAKWAARGFADPAAYIFFIAGVLPLIGARAESSTKFVPAFFAALLFALSAFMKPIVLPTVAVVLAGAGLAAVVLRQWRRLAGLCLGFVPVLSMAAHNWVYGHVFQPLTANATHPDVLVMPPSAYATALHELLTGNFGGGYLKRALMQIPAWLSGPAESYATVPLNAAGIAVLIYVVVRGRGFNPWLRLIGAAALAQHAVALFYINSGRYHFLAWFLTMLVAAVWLHDVGTAWLQRRFPKLWRRVAADPFLLRLASGLSRLEAASA